MNRRILRLAIPNVISNVTIPLLGLIAIAIAGRIDGDNAIGAMGIGTTVFGFIYWNCAFLRMGASGLTAQALGARNLHESANILVRSVVVALSIAALLLIFRNQVWSIANSVMSDNPAVMSMVAEYFFARVWAAPATVSHFAIQGWFIGMQNSRIPMYVAISINLISIACGWLFAVELNMGMAGIGWGTVVAQYSGIVVSAALWLRYYRRFIKYIDWRESLRLKPMLRFFDVNKDILIRTMCNVFVYTFLTIASSHLDSTLLATNMILIQLFTFFSYVSDGVAYAGEALTGRFVGAKNNTALRKSVVYIFWWSLAIAAFFVLLYMVFWKQVLGILNASPAVMESAAKYIVWIIIVPLVAFAPFLMDGILIGATKTRVLRNSMFVSTVLFFGMYYMLVGMIGNSALWLSFVTFLGVRAITQYYFSNKLEGILWHKATV